MVISVLATPSGERASRALDQGHRPIALYQMGRPEMPGVGHDLPHAVRRLPSPPSQLAWDFLSIALAVFGSDRFLLRSEAADGWTRVVSLNVELVNPEPWIAQIPRLAAALRFLTGDIWHLRFQPGGYPPPAFQGRLTDRDCACLFSGGLDSFIGAASLVSDQRRPILISQASPKEGYIQAYLAERLGMADHRFGGRVIEKGAAYEPSSRARSILFIAYGVMAAEHVGGTLFIPENGLISINPSLTVRRLGSLSTKTTHPHFISELEAVLRGAGLNVRLVNPYGLTTKGEMLANCADPRVAEYAHLTYSCGKGKRLNKQCGRCVPCLIRRASFKRAAIEDRTPYYAMDLRTAAANDDVLAARIAVEKLGGRDMDLWTGEAGPLPEALRPQYVDVVQRGLGELRDLLQPIQWL